MMRLRRFRIRRFRIRKLSRLFHPCRLHKSSRLMRFDGTLTPAPMLDPILDPMPDPILDPMPDLIEVDVCRKHGIDENRSLFYVHMARYIGTTVTIHTRGGGPSGTGFTGVLLSVACEYITLLTEQGSLPCCPLKYLGSVVHIPLSRIVSFSHNAV